MQTKRRVQILLVIILGVALCPVPIARAAFPGPNGRIAWNDDGQGHHYLAAAELDGDDYVELTHPNDHDQPDDRRPRWSPNGDWVAFRGDHANDQGESVSGIYVVRSDGTGVHLLRRDGQLAGWTPEGRVLLIRGDLETGNLSLWTIRVDGSHLEKLVQFGGSGRMSPFGIDMAPVTHWIVYSTPRGIMVERPNRTGRRSVFEANWPRVTMRPLDWSPDGGWLLYERSTPTIGDRQPTSDLYAIRIMDRRVRRITRTPDTLEWDAAWSPNGKRIAYVEPSAIYVIRADGGRPHRLSIGTYSYDVDWARR